MKGFVSAAKPVFIRVHPWFQLHHSSLDLDEMTISNALLRSGFVALPSVAQQGFDLWRDGESVGHFRLPVYLVSPKCTFWRIAATPFAALSDTTIIIAGCAAVAAIVGGVIYLELKCN